MSDWRHLAPVSFVCLLAGVELGSRSVFFSALLVAALLGLCLSLGSRARLVSWLAVGMLLRPPDPARYFQPDPERPSHLSGRVQGDWRSSDTHHSAKFQSHTLRQGDSTRIWRREIRLALPAAIEPPFAKHLAVTGYLKQTPPISNSRQTESSAWVMWVKTQAFLSPHSVQPANVTFGNLARRARSLARHKYRSCEGCSGSQGAALASALTLGTAGEVPEVWRSCLGRAGLNHLLALSGLHVGLLAALIWIVLSGVGVRSKYLFIAIVVIAYLFIAGARASLIRATLMLLGSYGAHIVRRPPQPLHVLNFIATGMLLLSPELSRDLGFLLTVSATAGILGLAPRLERVCSNLSLPLGKPLSVTIAAQTSTLPWVLPAFHYLAPFASFWNLIAVPWITLVFAASLAWMLALLIQPDIANRLIPILDLLAAPVSGICGLSPRLFQVLPSDSGFWLSAVPVCLLLVLLKLNRALWPVALGVSILIPLLWTRAPSDPQLVLLDVGQGEALIVRDGDAAVLVDGGGWRSGDIAQSVLLPALSSLGVQRLDGALLTHPDLDHCGGLIKIGRYLDLPVIWIGVGWQRSSCLDELATLPGSRLGALWRGESINVGRWHLEIIHPPAGTIARGNSESLVMLASVMNKRVLLTGDIDAAVERRLVTDLSDQVGQVDVLKLAHHGSKTSTSEVLLDQVQPALGLISCGVGNRYRHPSVDVELRLAARGIPVLRTDRSGAIVLTFFRDKPIRIEFPGSPKGTRLLQ